MNIVKITNLMNNGLADYKGLDLNNIVGGTQLYPDYANDAYFFYDGDVAEGNGVQLVTQATYDEHKNTIANQPKPKTEAEQIVELKVNLFKTNQAVDETNAVTQQLIELLDELGVIS